VFAYAQDSTRTTLLQRSVTLVQVKEHGQWSLYSDDSLNKVTFVSGQSNFDWQSLLAFQFVCFLGQ